MAEVTFAKIVELVDLAKNQINEVADDEAALLSQARQLVQQSQECAQRRRWLEARSLRLIQAAGDPAKVKKILAEEYQAATPLPKLKDPKPTGRKLAPMAAAKPQPKPAAKVPLAKPVQKQSFNQWARSLDKCGGPNVLNQEEVPAHQYDRAKQMFHDGIKPAEAAKRFKETVADPRPTTIAKLGLTDQHMLDNLAMSEIRGTGLIPLILVFPQDGSAWAIMEADLSKPVAKYALRRLFPTDLWKGDKPETYQQRRARGGPAAKRLDGLEVSDAMGRKWVLGSETWELVGEEPKS